LEASLATSSETYDNNTAHLAYKQTRINN